MDQSKFLSVLRQVIREELRTVIKEQLTEILQEGLQSTIAELSSNPINETTSHVKPKHNKVKFGKNKFHGILNNTESLREAAPLAMNSYADLMSENITMTSADAMNFGVQRKAMKSNLMQPTAATPATMLDPETGKEMVVDPIVAKALTRDYSELMSAMNKKK
jgi:hypothetical protein